MHRSGWMQPSHHGNPVTSVNGKRFAKQRNAGSAINTTTILGSSYYEAATAITNTTICPTAATVAVNAAAINDDDASQEAKV